MESIYGRYGDLSFWEGIMDQFYNKNLADPQLQEFFIDKDVKRIKKMNQELLCAAFSPSPNHFPISIKRVHSHLNITKDDFTRFLLNYEKALLESHVSQPDATEIIEMIGSFREDLVKPLN